MHHVPSRVQGAEVLSAPPPASPGPLHAWHHWHIRHLPLTRNARWFEAEWKALRGKHATVPSWMHDWCGGDVTLPTTQQARMTLQQQWLRAVGTTVAASITDGFGITTWWPGAEPVRERPFSKVSPLRDCGPLLQALTGDTCDARGMPYAMPPGRASRGPMPLATPFAMRPLRSCIATTVRQWVELFGSREAPACLAAAPAFGWYREAPPTMEDAVALWDDYVLMVLQQEHVPVVAMHALVAAETVVCILTFAHGHARVGCMPRRWLIPLQSLLPCLFAWLPPALGCVFRGIVRCQAPYFISGGDFIALYGTIPFGSVATAAGHEHHLRGQLHALLQPHDESDAATRIADAVRVMTCDCSHCSLLWVLSMRPGPRFVTLLRPHAWLQDAMLVAARLAPMAMWAPEVLDALQLAFVAEVRCLLQWQGGTSEGATAWDPRRWRPSAAMSLQRQGAGIAATLLARMRRPAVPLNQPCAAACSPTRLVRRLLHQWYLPQLGRIGAAAPSTQLPAASHISAVLGSGAVTAAPCTPLHGIPAPVRLSTGAFTTWLHCFLSGLVCFMPAVAPQPADVCSCCLCSAAADAHTAAKLLQC